MSSPAIVEVCLRPESTAQPDAVKAHINQLLALVEDDVKQLSANTDPDEFLRDLGQMAGMMGMNGGSDEAAKLAQAFKLSESLSPGTAPTADSMAQMADLNDRRRAALLRPAPEVLMGLVEKPAIAGSVDDILRGEADWEEACQALSEEWQLMIEVTFNSNKN